MLFRTGSHVGCRVRAGLFDQLLERAAALNAEALAVREGREQVGSKTGGVAALQSVPVSVANRKPEACAAVLTKMGCLGFQNALSGDTADELLAFVVAENARCQAAVLAGDSFDSFFGGVNCRGTDGMFGRRQDLFLPLDAPPVRAAVAELLRALSPVLDSLVGREAMLHEVSSIVAEPGSPRQCLHADTIVLPCPQYPDVTMPPLYTFFVALQDVEPGMGATQFLPMTHTPAAHELWNAAARSEQLKQRFVACQAAVQSDLRRGDVAAFDSRVLHAGCANETQKRRVLFYVTLSSAQRWPLPGGLHGSNSVRAEDRWKWRVCDLIGAEDKAMTPSA